MAADADDKVALRAELRRRRRALPDQAERSARVCATLVDLVEATAVSTVLVFDAVPGEPALGALVDRCVARGVSVAVPEDGVDPRWPDLVVVPGVAFTPGGDRLGQGGGWYDRFLAAVRPGCITVGVCFAPLIVDRLPVEPHDVAVDVVVTDEHVWRPGVVDGTPPSV